MLALLRARMAKKCLPRLDADDWFAIYGSADEDQGADAWPVDDLPEHDDDPDDS